VTLRALDKPTTARRHGSLSACLGYASQYLGITPADVFVSWLPLHHDFGLVRFAFGPVFFGAPCHLLAPSLLNLERWLVTLTRARGTLTGAPDFAYRLATRMVAPGGIDLSALRLATNGGEPVRADTIRAFEARFGLSGVVRAAYGLAEATLTVSCHTSGPSPRVDALGHVSNGPAVPGIEVRIAGQAGAPCRTGEAGEIQVRGESVFSGYFDPDEPAARLPRNQWVATGDLGYLDGDGHLYVLGRLKSLIKTAGRAIAPAEVGWAADQEPGVRLAAAVGLPNPALDGLEDVVVVAEVRPEAGSSPARVAARLRREADRLQAEIHLWRQRPVPPRLRRAYSLERSVGATRAFRPARYAGDAILFCARSLAVADTWRPWVGGPLDPVRLDADHEALLAPAPAAEMARALLARLCSDDTPGPAG
jgi:fatty-acyl-CoA synthase